jgi:protocatechuate 3,4-dioxygenase beta subunit
MSHEHERGPFDRGLAEDLRVWKQQLLGRRRLLKWVAYGGALIACGEEGASDPEGGSGNTNTSTTSASSGSCPNQIPAETAGPYPGDGTNGPNVLTIDGVVRSDIRTSIGSASGVAGGVPVTLRMTVRSLSCTPLQDYVVYIWQCDREGRYSMYSAGAENENYLRGVQQTDENGVVEFVTVFPACYPGRWPHIHFEIYTGLSEATVGRNAAATSQLAFPKAECDEVFTTTGYQASVANLAALTLQTDGVFRDGVDLQLPAITGNATDGYAATLEVTINA